MIWLLSSLTIVAQIFILAALGAVLIQLVTARRPWDWLVDLVGGDSLRLAALVAIVATAGSLYMSEVRHFIPCVLCWYQRIAMYPLALLIPLMIWLAQRRAALYGLALSVPGFFISVYHYQLERFPDQKTVACSVDVPCTTIWFESFGYITISMMAMTAFALISLLLIIHLTKENSHG